MVTESRFIPDYAIAPGEIIEDEHVLTIPPKVGAGEYNLLVGLYLVDTLDRLPAVDEAGSPLPCHQLVISGITVLD